MLKMAIEVQMLYSVERHKKDYNTIKKKLLEEVALKYVTKSVLIDFILDWQK